MNYVRCTTTTVDLAVLGNTKIHPYSGVNFRVGVVSGDQKNWNVPITSDHIQNDFWGSEIYVHAQLLWADLGGRKFLHSSVLNGKCKGM